MAAPLEPAYRRASPRGRKRSAMQHRTTESVRQGYLFKEGDTPESRTLMKTLHAINRRMGRGTVFYGGSGIRRE